MKKDIIKLIQKQLKAQGTLYYMWPEADGSSGYIIRKDGMALGISDYQDFNSIPVPLEKLQKNELSKLLNAEKFNFNNEDLPEEITSCIAFRDWVNCKLDSLNINEHVVLVFDGSNEKTNTNAVLKEDIIYYDNDKKENIIIKKGDVGINFYDNIAGDSMCGFFVYLPIKNGYSLRIPYQKVDFPLKNKYLELVEKYNNNEILNAKINKEKDGFDIVYPNVNNCHKKHHI